MIMVPVIVVEARPHRPNPDPPAIDAECSGQFAGNGGGRSAGARGADERLTGQRELRAVRAGSRDDGAMQRGRRVREQLRHVRRPGDDIVAVCMAHGLDAFPGEERDGDTLRHDEGQEEQQRELARKAPRHQPHASSTLPAKR